MELDKYIESALRNILKNPIVSLLRQIGHRFHFETVQFYETQCRSITLSCVAAFCLYACDA